MKSIKSARQCVVSAFATHWKRILRTRRDLVKERADCFFAGSVSVQKRIAREFYGREHAREMANLDAKQILDLLAPWLEPAVQYWRDDGWLLGGNFLAELVTAEYVTIVDGHGRSGRPLVSGRLIGRYPGNGDVAYDDLYERLLSGFSIGGVLRVYKSTGERFTPFEARSARAGIRRDLLDGIASAGDDDPWGFNMNAEGQYPSGNIEEEDFGRVIIVEANDFTDVDP